MAAFDAQYDAQAAWEERLFATVPQPAQVREAADMQSAKVSVLGKGTVVQVLDRCVLDNGTVRVRVAPAEDAGLGGWLSAKVLGDWRALPPSRGAIKRLHYGWKAGSEFSLISSKTPDGGVFFLRGVVGADPKPGAPAPTVVVFAHGGGYNLGVWIPVIEHLHVLWREAGETYEVVALDWIGHGHGRRLPGEGAAADRFDIASLGPDDVFAVLDDAGADDARFATAGRRVVGVGHSNGGMILALSEQRRPGAFAGLVLFEPIIYDSDALGTTASDNFLWLEGMAAKRKYEFEVGREDNFGVASRYFDKALMGWEAGAKRYYVEFGMREVRRVGAASVVLYCPKDVEQALFANTPVSAAKAFRGLGKIRCPVRVCCGGASKTLGNTGLDTPEASVQLNRANFRRISDAVASPRKTALPGFESDGPVAVCPAPVTHDIPQMDAAWSARFVAASLRHDLK